MNWINVNDKLPSQSENFLCLFHEEISGRIKKHYYVCHMYGVHYHCRLRPYENCWKINTDILIPMRWIPLKDIK
jgi:hypothetical protein